MPVSIKPEPGIKEEGGAAGAGGGAKAVRSYTVTLLQDAQKTLGQVLPAIKLPAKRK